MTVTDAMFSPETYVETRKPLDQATALPGWCYASPEWYAREVETIFRKEWLCVGRGDQVPNPGDFFSIEIVGQPMIVVRDRTGRVHVHSAICRHRGAVVTEGSGNCRAFVCPYHGWVYSLDGRLTGTPGKPPPMEGVENFDHADYGLAPIRSETWGGFIFITFDPAAPPLLQWLGDLPEFLAGYGLEDMRWTYRDSYEVPCNWKIWLENAFENYHVPTIHRKHYDPANPQHWVFEHGKGPWHAMFGKRSIGSFKGLPEISTLDAEKASRHYHLWIQPSVQLILNPHYVKFRQYMPLGPDKVRLYENWTFPRATIALPDFSEIVKGYYKYSEIVEEDYGINPVVHRSMATGAYRPGRYSLQECLVHRIANYVLDRVVGPDARRSRKTPASKAAE
ncbi:MAG: aromatic ring-hydroxylating dioxygenase subunit alpha [Rhodospirillales bacterium]|nr:aromatic ring-hydroxylating dioxygenase subunit alpha [Rhodospirillales bacterium]